ncbi:MAG: class II aldolase/adducin family protein [Actinomycetes bacterium]
MNDQQAGAAELLAALAPGLIQAGRRAADAGLVVGSGGNLSARLPGAGQLVVTRTGSWLDTLDVSDLSVVALRDGRVLAGHPLPTSELPLHLHTYRARADVNALVHLHSQTTVLLSALGEQVRLLSTDHVFYVRGVVVVAFAAPGSEEVARAGAAAAASGANCLVLDRHGVSVLGPDVELAYRRAANLEEAARATYAALVLGRTLPDAPAAAWEWAERTSTA